MHYTELLKSVSLPPVWVTSRGKEDKPVRTNPTARQLRLGTELRKLRERAGLTATEAGQLLGAKQTLISNIEAGRAG